MAQRMLYLEVLFRDLRSRAVESPAVLKLEPIRTETLLSYNFQIPQKNRSLPVMLAASCRVVVAVVRPHSVTVVPWLRISWGLVTLQSQAEA